MNREQQETALTHIRSSDPTMRRLMDAVGPFALRPERKRRFSVLARAIISQQVSTAAARTIRGRLEGILDNGGLAPEGLARLTESQLRSVGLSRQEASYLLDLAEKTLDGTVRLDRIGRLADEAVIEMLTRVKGIGRVDRRNVPDLLPRATGRVAGGRSWSSGGHQGFVRPCRFAG